MDAKAEKAENLLRYAADKLAKYDPTANDAARHLEEAIRGIQNTYGPLTGAAIDNAREAAGITEVSNDNSALRADLLTGIRLGEAFKWYAMTLAGKPTEEISLTSRSNVSTVEDSVHLVREYVKLSTESQEDTGSEAS